MILDVPTGTRVSDEGGRTPPSTAQRKARRVLPWAVLGCALAAAGAAVWLTAGPAPERSEPEPSTATHEEPPGPVWSDEFDGPAGTPADSATWSYEQGGSGWGNDELQHYVDGPDAAFHDGAGHLVVEAREVDPTTTELGCWYGGCAFTSARLVSAQKQEVQYGRIETRLLLPEGAGIWPAVWMLGSDIGEVGWPQSGEIDVMEFVGHAPDEIFGTIHGPGYSGGEAFGGVRDLGRPAPGDWHVAAIEWTPGRIVWEVDDVVYHEATPDDVAPDAWVFDHPFFFVINLAVGGNFGGPLGEGVRFPQRLTVDYLRVYQFADPAG
jgi:beta-glucanase (GH16 family)